MAANFSFSGKLYLIPTTLGESNPIDVLPLTVKKHVERIDHYIAENDKTARRAIKKLVPQKKQQILKFKTLNKFTEVTEIPNFLDACKEGFASKWNTGSSFSWSFLDLTCHDGQRNERTGF